MARVSGWTAIASFSISRASRFSPAPTMSVSAFAAAESSFSPSDAACSTTHGAIFHGLGAS